MDTSATVEDTSSLPQTGLWRRHGFKLVLSLVLGAGIAWVVSRGGLPLVPPREAFAQLKTWTIPAYVASLFVVHYFRAARWRFLLRLVGKVERRSVLAVSWIAFGILIISPLRSGEIARPYLITRRSNVRLWEATSTIGAERIIDGLALSLILFLGLSLSTPLSPLPDHVGELPVPAAAVPGAAYSALVLFVSAFALMIFFYVARGLARRLTHAIVGIVSHKLADRLAAIVERVADGLRFLSSPRHTAPFLLETALYWITNAAGVWLLAWGSGLTDVTLAQAAVTMGCLGIGILVPSGPGYFGAFQLSTYMALAMFFPESVLKGPGAAFVFLFYVTQIGFHLLATVIGLFIDIKPRVPEGDVEAEVELPKQEAKRSVLSSVDWAGDNA